MGKGQGRPTGTAHPGAPAPGSDGPCARSSLPPEPKEVVARGMTRPSSGSELRPKLWACRPGRNDTKKGRARKGVRGWGRWQEAEHPKKSPKTRRRKPCQKHPEDRRDPGWEQHRSEKPHFRHHPRPSCERFAPMRRRTISGLGRGWRCALSGYDLRVRKGLGLPCD